MQPTAPAIVSAAADASPLDGPAREGTPQHRLSIVAETWLSLGIGRLTGVVNRRHFLCAAAASAASMWIREAFAQRGARYDLIVRGGRVIDPSRGLDAIRDVAIVGGRIAAVDPSISADAADTLDARGKLVVPGLIDIHTHAAASKEGPALCLGDGVTGFIDAGTRGAERIAEIIAVAKAAPQQCRVLLNIGRNGLLPEGDTTDIRNADVLAARAAIASNRDYIVGIKARLSRDAAGSNDYETLRRAQEVAVSFDLPVMIHMGQSVSSMPRLLPLLKRGDIVTHLFAPPPNSIIDEAGRLLPEVIEARRRGVWFDVGNGRGAPFNGGSTEIGHLRWDIADRVIRQGFLPDTFSTDWSRRTYRPGH